MRRIIREKIVKTLSSDLNRKIFSQSFWIVLGNVISKFTLLIATIFMAKYLDKEEYGQFGIIKSTILMFAMFAGMELGMTATKFIAQYRFSQKRKLERIVGMSTFFAIVISILISFLIYLFAIPIAYQINAPNLNTEIKISAFILFFSSVNGIQNGILAGIEKFKELSINSAMSGIISSVLLILAARFYTLDVVIIAFGANYVLFFIFNFITLRKKFYSEFKIEFWSKENFKEIKILWDFSFPAFLAGLMVAPVVWYANYVLVNQPSGYLQMANFDIASQWRNTILFIPAALSQIALPLLSSRVEDKAQYRMVYNKNLKINIVLAFFLVIVFVILSPLIVDFYGAKYNDLLWPIIIMFITTGLISINNVIGQAIASQGKMWLGFYANLMWAIILTVSTHFLVEKEALGAIGLSLAYLISYFCHAIIQFLYIRRYLN